MPVLESVPWFAVGRYNVVLDRAGQPRWIRHLAAGRVTLFDGSSFPVDPMSTVIVLVPTFKDALGILEHAFPGLEQIG